MAVPILDYAPFWTHPNLVLYAPLNGSSVDDKGSNDGTDANITYNSGNGKFGQGAGLNGTSSKITFADLPIGAAFTIMMWVKPTNDWAAGSEGLWDTKPSDVGATVIRGGGDGTLRYSLGGVGNANTSATGNLAGVYHHLAMVGTGNNTLRIVLDGVSIGSNTFGGTFSSNTFLIGNINNTDWFAGAVDEIAYFSTNIATADILTYVNFSADSGSSPMLFGGGLTIG